MTNGPKMDWTRDNKQYDCFIQWQKICKMIYWMATEGHPLIEKWENTGKVTYEGDVANRALE